MKSAKLHEDTAELLKKARAKYLQEDTSRNHTDNEVIKYVLNHYLKE